jgi:hypothetical protein
LVYVIDGVEPLDPEVEELIGSLQLCTLSDPEGILYVNPEIANCTLDLGMAEQDLHRAQVAGLLVDDGRLCSAQ